jgi:phosphoenolpyruvate-protein kinase (PTS system EI component)
MKKYIGLPGACGLAYSRAIVIHSAQTNSTRRLIDDVNNETEPFVIVADDLSLEEAERLNKKLFKGFITENGGPASHCVIFAKNLGIPAVVGAKGILDKILDGQVLYLNGDEGYAIVEPEI